MDSLLYPPVPDGKASPLRAIAVHIGCDEAAVGDAFRGLDFPEWAVPDHLDAIQETTHVLNEAERHATNLSRTLAKLTKEQRQEIGESGVPTLAQIELLAAVLRGDIQDLSSWRRRFNRSGGRVPAAYIIAEGMRRLFRRLRRPVTFGQHPEGGPSTDFGRAVEFGLGSFGVRSDWRRPAQKAYEKQRGIQERLDGWKSRKVSRAIAADPLKSPELAGISLDFDVIDGVRTALIKLEGRKDVFPLRVPLSKFPNPLELKEFVLDWAAQNGFRRS